MRGRGECIVKNETPSLMNRGWITVSDNRRWVEIVAIPYMAAACVVLSNFDVRQSIVFVLGAVLLGLIAFILSRSRQWGWVVTIVFAFGLTLYSDIDQIPELLGSRQLVLGGSIVSLALFGLLSRRWLFSLLVVTFLISVIWIASVSKFEYVGTPLIWHDLLVGLQSWEMFLEMETANVAVAIGVLFLFPLFWRMQPKQPFRTSLFGACALLAASMPVLVTAKIPDISKLGKVSFAVDSGAAVPVDPIALFIGSIAHIDRLRPPSDAEGKTATCCLHADRLAEKLDKLPGNLPHIAVVLMESTFDSATLDKDRRSEFFEDAYALQVHTIGGETWVAEYGLLHGVASPLYGPAYHAINLLGPGSADGRLPVILRSAGYATTTIYPVAGRFYGAQTFHHSLGMETFIGCPEVPGCQASGWPDRPDRLFLDQAIDVLTRSQTPQFVFLPTIQQHSPHDVEGAPTGATVECNFSPVQCRVLREYRRRLANSLADFRHFQTQVRALDRDTIVLAFGDHIPADVNRYFENRHFETGRKRTFFTVWHSRHGYLTSEMMRRVGLPPSLDVAYLDWVVGRAVGLDSDYFRQKESMIQRCAGEFCFPGT